MTKTIPRQRRKENLTMNILVFACYYYLAAFCTMAPMAFVCSYVMVPSRMIHRSRNTGTSLLNGRSNDEEESTAAEASKSSSCPYSKSFPRYRIDLTRFKQKDTSSSSSWLQSPFQKFSQTMARSKLEQQFKTATVVWEPELDGISAFSYLWNQAANLCSTTNDDEVMVIALPDASRQVVQNWVEIIEWMSTLEDHPMMQPKISAEMVGDDMPIVRLEKVASVVPIEIIEANTDSVTLQIKRTQAWVKRILVEQGICPFTKSTKRSGQGLGDFGVPVGNIAYHGSYATHVIPLMADTWVAMDQMIQAGPSGKTGVSSILLTAPAFDEDFDVWSGPIFAMLETGVVAAQAEADLGVVCFHPRYATPDGKSWPGFGHMHSVPRLEKWYKEVAAAAMRSSPTECPKFLTTEEIAAGGAWQRRTPHATINVLRADQLAAAEGRRQSGSMYTSNIQRLVVEIGLDKLTQDLDRERQLNQ